MKKQFKINNIKAQALISNILSKESLQNIKGGSEDPPPIEEKIVSPTSGSGTSGGGGD